MGIENRFRLFYPLRAVIILRTISAYSNENPHKPRVLWDKNREAQKWYVLFLASRSVHVLVKRLINF